MTRPLLCLLLVAWATCGCTPSRPATPASSSPPVRRAVADHPPYVCTFIPRDAVAELTSYTGAYKAGPEASREPRNSCVVSNDERSIFITSYTKSARRDMLDTFTANGANQSPAPLPAELGQGQLQNFEARLFRFRHAGVWFRCGATNPFVSIAVMKNPARDQDYDLAQLLTIAERRYGEMFGCTPAPDPR